MAGQIIFFSKNVADYSNSSVTATATQASEFAAYVLNRSNDSAWVTSGSVDADLTEIEINFADARYINSLLLIKHNFKAYTAQYYDGSSWQNFPTPISETTNTETTTYHSFSEVLASRVKVVVQGTMTANSDKSLCQLIATEKLGQLNGWPVIKSPKHERISTQTRMLSGKINLTQAVGAFRCELQVPHWRDTADLALIESLYFANEGFLVWLCGGDEDQFFTRVRGYRKEDIYLMRCAGDFQPEWVQGLYNAGLNLKIPLVEVNE